MPGVFIPGDSGAVVWPRARLGHRPCVIPEPVLEWLSVRVAIEVPNDDVAAVPTPRQLALLRHVPESAMRHEGPNLNRRDWLVECVPHGEAVAAIRAWHYSHSAPNTGQAHGLFARDGAPFSAIVGAALWLPPTRRAAEKVAGESWRGVLSLSRLAVDPALPRNAASFLLAGSMRLLDRDRWPVLLTFADSQQGHTGAIYKATGWTLDGLSSSGSYWVRDGVQVGRKRGKRNIRAADLRADGYTEVRSEKLRYVHRRTAA